MLLPIHVNGEQLGEAEKEEEGEKEDGEVDERAGEEVGEGEVEEEEVEEEEAEEEGEEEAGEEEADGREEDFMWTTWPFSYLNVQRTFHVRVTWIVFYGNNYTDGLHPLTTCMYNGLFIS